MDSNRFDALVKAWVSTSRRRLLQGAMSASLSGLSLLHREQAGAEHFECRHVGARCKSKDQCCSGICRGKDRKRCRAYHTSTCKTTQDTCAAGGVKLQANECGTSDFGDKCYCYVTTGGAPFCSHTWNCGPCDKDSEVFAGTAPGAACVDCPYCPDGTLYALPCDNPDR